MNGAEPFEFGKGKDAILFIHGWSSTPRELRFLAEKFSDQFFCKGILLPGHGTHPDNLIDCHWEDYLSLAIKEFQELSQTYKRVFVIGLSFGGTLTLELCKTQKVEAAVLIAPFIHLSSPSIFGYSKESIIKRLPNFLPHIEKEKNGGINDPIQFAQHVSYKRMPVDGLKNLFDSVEHFTQNLEQINNPLLLLHSTSDRTSSFDNSIEILKKTGPIEKSLIVYTKSNHILTLDYDRLDVESKIMEWILNKSK